MTDGTRPNESDPAAASPPPPPVPPAAEQPQPAPPAAAEAPQSAPPAAAAPPVQPPPPAYAAPVPPYAAAQPPYATAANQGAATTYPGVPHQEYPGAPPVWGPPGGAPAPGAPWQPHPPAAGSPVLAILALVAAIVGVMASFLPFVGGPLAWLLFIAAIVLAIVALVRRAPGKGMAVAGIVVSVLGFGFSVLWSIALLIFSGWNAFSSSAPYTPAPYSDDEYESGYDYPFLSAPELGADGNTPSDPLAPGTGITLFDDTAGADAWEMTVLPFEDLTEAALANGEVDPAVGAYVGVPVQLTNTTDETIDLTTEYTYLPYSFFVTSEAGEAAPTFFYDVETYPSVYDLDSVAPGETITFYDIYDVPPGSAAVGAYGIDLDSGQTVYWGAGAL